MNGRTAILIAAYAASSLPAQEGGIEIFTGETLFKEGLRVSITEIYKPKTDLYSGSTEITNVADTKLIEHRSVVGLDYGFDSDFTASVLLPLVHKRFTSAGLRASTAGLGDTAVLTKYRLIQDEWQAGGFNWAVVSGLELPTGATDETENGVRLPTSAQLGSGAWNPFLATSATLGSGRARFDASVFYKLNTEGAQQTETGDFFSADISAAYRFLHYKYPGPTFGARIGLQYRHDSRSEVNGVTAANSGADELLLRPALSIHPIPRMDLNIGARIPVYQHYNGEQLGRGGEWFIAFGLRF